MKKIILLAFLSVIYGKSFAQNSKGDSLKHQLAIAKQDTSRILLISDLIGYYIYNKPDSAFKYGANGLKLLQRTNYPKGEARLLGRLGSLYRETGNLPKALDFAMKSMAVSEQNHYLLEKRRAVNAIGVVYFDLGDYTKAINYYTKAINYYQQTTGIAKELKDQSGIGALNIASCYIELGKLHSADSCIRIASRDLQGANSVYLWREIGRLDTKSGNYPLALIHLKKARQTALRSNDHRNASYVYAKIADVFEKTHQTDSVIFYSKLGLQEAQFGPYNKFILMSAQLLVRAYKTKNDFKNALLYEELAAKTKEGLFGAGNIQAINEIIAQDNARKKEIDAQKIAYQNQAKQYALLAGVAMLLLTAFILYRNNRQKHTANKLLEKTLANLTATQAQLIQSEKMASLGELTAGIAHEIQNPLNFVNNFSEVNTEMIDELESELKSGNIDEALAIAAEIKGNEQKINHHGKRADSIVKGMLQHSKASSGQKEPTNINALADEYMRLSYHGLRSKDKSFNAELTTHFDKDLLQVNVMAQDIGRVLLNLFNNAFYAVHQKQETTGADYKPEVTVTTLTENGQVIIKVKDNGIGIPDAIKEKIMQPFFTTKPTGEGTGLGLSLSYDIVVKGHGGSIAVDTKEGEFTEFIVTLPLN
jgi:two-component system NtrC family sensor kinase